MADDAEEELPTSAEGGEDKQEEKPETVIVDCDGGIIVYSRLPDGTLAEGCEFSDTQLMGDDVGLSDEDLRRAAEAPHRRHFKNRYASSTKNSMLSHE